MGKKREVKEIPILALTLDLTPLDLLACGEAQSWMQYSIQIYMSPFYRSQITRACMHMHAHTRTCTPPHTHTHTHMHARTRTHARTNSIFFPSWILSRESCANGMLHGYHRHTLSTTSVVMECKLTEIPPVCFCRPKTTLLFGGTLVWTRRGLHILASPRPMMTCVWCKVMSCDWDMLESCTNPGKELAMSPRYQTVSLNKILC